MSISKLTNSSTAASYIKDGDSIVLFGGWEPTSLIRELLYANRRNLRIFAHSFSIGVDILLQRDVVTEMYYSSDHDVTLHDRSALFRVPESVLRSQLSAAIADLEFTPIAYDINVPFSSSELYKQVLSPFSNTQQLAASAIRPDVALLHVPRADISGHIQLDAADDHRIADVLRLACAAKRVIVSAEQVVSYEAITQNSNATILPADKVCAVVEVPFGAYPLGCGCRYNADSAFISSYIEAKNNGTYHDFIDNSLLCDKNWDTFLNSLGFDKLMALSTNRRGE